MLDIRSRHYIASSTIMSFLGVLLFASLAVPMRFYCFDVGTISSFSTVEPVLAMASIYVAVCSLRSMKIDLGPTFLFFIFAIPVALSIISLAWTTDISYTLNGVLVHTEALVAYVVVLNLFAHQTLKFHVVTLILFSSVLILASVFSYPLVQLVNPQIPLDLGKNEVTDFVMSYNARLSHPFIGLSNNLATIFALLLPVTASIWFSLRSRACYLLVVILFGGMLATMSRGVILAALLAFSYAGVARILTKGSISRRIINNIPIFFAGAVVIFVAFLAIAPDAPSQMAGRLSTGNMIDRLEKYRLALELIANRPWFGYGSAVPLSMYGGGKWVNIHNAYLQSMFWYGVPLGGGLCLAMFLSPVVLARIPVKSAVAHVLRSGLVIMMIGQLLINITQSSWEGSMLRVIIYSLFGLGVSTMAAAQSNRPA